MSGDIIPFKYPKPTIREPSGFINLTVRDAATELWEFNKIAIVGGPGAGKTYLANLLNKVDSQRGTERQVWCSDVFNYDVPWEGQPVAITDRLRGVDHWIAEGIAVLRAIRNGWLKPDVIVLRDTPIRPLGDVQARLWFQCQRWFADYRSMKHLDHPPVYRIVPMELSKG